MAPKTTIYAPMDDNNEFVRELFQLHNEWAQRIGNRALWPSCDGQQVHVNQNGIGIEMDGVIATLPPRLAGLVPSAVVITDKYIINDEAMKTGTYQYGRYTKAIVTAEVITPSSHPSYLSTTLVVTSTSPRSAVRFYNKIRTGVAQPKVTWPTGNKQ